MTSEKLNSNSEKIVEIFYTMSNTSSIIEISI